MKKELPKRKHPRLDMADYSSSGAYFVTICTQNRKCIFSNIVGRGLAPAENAGDFDEDSNVRNIHTKFGEIAEEQLLLLEKRFKNLSVNIYEIMPNHIHMILILSEDKKTACDYFFDETHEAEINLAGKGEAGASPRPTIMDVVCAFKSLTTKECRKAGFVGKLFQTSFYEHIIRDSKDFDNIAEYIHENPAKWADDEMFEEDECKFE